MSTDKTKTDDVTGGGNKDELKARGVDTKSDEGGGILPLEQITIDKVWEDGIRIESSQLLGCFYAPQRDGVEYLFFGHDGHERQRKIRNGAKFLVEFSDGKVFELTVHFSENAKKDEPKAHGNWKDMSDGNTGDGGTYTAQAGGGAVTAAYA